MGDHFNARTFSSTIDTLYVVWSVYGSTLCSVSKHVTLSNMLCCEVCVYLNVWGDHIDDNLESRMGIAFGGFYLKLSDICGVHVDIHH